jgi:hypothetical protein
VQDTAHAAFELAIDVGAELVQDPAPFVKRVLLPPIRIKTPAKNAFYQLMNIGFVLCSYTCDEPLDVVRIPAEWMKLWVGRLERSGNYYWLRRLSVKNYD